MAQFTYHMDEQHGWLEVTESDLAAFGLSVADISEYSHQSWDGTRLYLECDSDAGRFSKAWEKVNGTEFRRHEHYEIREDQARRIRHMPRLGRTFLPAA